MKVCPNCNQENLNEAMFCEFCGSSLSFVTPEPTVSEEATTIYENSDTNNTSVFGEVPPFDESYNEINEEKTEKSIADNETVQKVTQAVDDFAKEEMPVFGIVAGSVSIALGGLAFFFNPCLIFLLVAIVFAILGVIKGKKYKFLGFIGLGVCAIELINEIIFAVISFGASLLI